MNLPKVQGVYERLGLLREAKPRKFECKFDGLSYSGRLDQRIDQHIFYFGAYSANELSFLAYAARALAARRQGVSFVDIGANVGQHSLFMARRVAKVLAFEPGLEAAVQFQENLNSNGVENVTLVRCALGHEPGIAELGSGLPGNNGSRSLNWSLDPTMNSMVTVLRADEAIRDSGIGRVDIVKMDVEGHEKKVLTGMVQTLLTDRPVILFELVGGESKGGFHTENELRQFFYPDHILYALGGGKAPKLLPFSWACDEAVCIPVELAGAFRPLMI
jgi:FkbM family methyltransferase